MSAVEGTSQTRAGRDGPGREDERDPQVGGQDRQPQERDRRQVAAMLDDLIAAGRPSSRTLPLPEGRRNFNELVASLTSAGEVASVRDAAIEGPAGQVPVRVYRPRQAVAGGPAALFMHGGGWVFGDLESHDGLCRALAEASGVVIVAVHYRRAPEAPFPGALEDCLAAARWLAGNGSELGVDGGRLAVAGDSSGGNLAAALAAVARDDGAPRVALQCLIYPALDPSLSTASYAEHAEDPFLSRDEMAWYWDRYTTPQQRADVRAAPGRRRDCAGLPPAIVVTAGHDPLRDEGLEYARALEAAGVPVALHHHPQMPHGFLLYGRYLDRAREVITETGTALAAGLRSA